jgi:hypothetical protein
MKIDSPWIALFATSVAGIFSCLYLAFQWGGTPSRIVIGIGVLVTFLAHCHELRKGKARGAGRDPALRRRLLTIELAFGLITAWALVKSSLS